MAKSFKFFASYLEAAEALPEKDRGIFLYAVCKYGIEGVEVPLKNSLLPLWLLTKPHLDTSRSYSESGARGGRPRKPPFQNPEPPLSDSQKPNMKENMKENMNRNRNIPPIAPMEGAERASNPPCDIFKTFAGEDGELLQALREYDSMRQEKGKPLTDTMRRSLCKQLDKDFHPCEWPEIVSQATLHGWQRFYPLEVKKPAQSPAAAPEETAAEQIDRIINNLMKKG